VPKLIDYPRAGLKAAMELAQAVDDLGGTSSIEMAAEKLNKRMSGAFQAQVSATVKYGLVTSKNQKLVTTPLYREIKLAYNDAERENKLRQAFLQVPLFREIHQRFAGKELPTSHFEKLLIREFDVPEDWSSRIASYFIDGGRAAGLIGEGNRLTELDAPSITADADPVEISATSAPPPQSERVIDVSRAPSSKNYVVHISGPSLNSNIEINELEDLEIVNVMLKKVAKALQDR
jgi:hypothetical protein